MMERLRRFRWRVFLLEVRTLIFSCKLVFHFEAAYSSARKSGL